MKPFDTYFGGKQGSGTYQTIINQIPPHRIYVEPFCGGGGIFRMKRPAAISLLNDRDPDVVERWVANGIPLCQSVMALQPGAQITVSSALLQLQMFDYEIDQPDVFIYLDPPYMQSTRKSSHRYQYELADEDHSKLLDIILKYKHAKVAISGYPSELYENMLSDWRCLTYQSTTRGAVATEHLYMNYPEPVELHDYRYLGDD